MEQTITKITATFIVLAEGTKAQRIMALAQQQAAFDPTHRRVIAVDQQSAVVNQIRQRIPDTQPAAVVVDHRNEICACLDLWRATTPAWIEDAFLQTQRTASLRQ
jgi:hypothetical protein